jgi:hypothetical protein
LQPSPPSLDDGYAPYPDFLSSDDDWSTLYSGYRSPYADNESVDSTAPEGVSPPPATQPPHSRQPQ